MNHTFHYETPENQKFAHGQRHCHCSQKIKNKFRMADTSGSAVQGVGYAPTRLLRLRVPILPGHECLSLIIVLSTTERSRVQRVSYQA
jgi:hypothetical protein